MKKACLVLLFSCLCCSLHSYIRLNDVMTDEEQKITGVDKLNAKQRAALQSWINKMFILKDIPTENANVKIYVVENYNSGTRLYMSNHKTYEVAPEDRAQAAFWLSPFPITIEANSNADYPLKLMNAAVGTGIAVRQLSDEEVRVFEEEDRLRRQNRQLEEELKALQPPAPSYEETHPHPHPHPESPVETAPTSLAPSNLPIAPVSQASSPASKYTPKNYSMDGEFDISAFPAPSYEEYDEEILLELPKESDYN